MIASIYRLNMNQGAHLVPLNFHIFCTLIIYGSLASQVPMPKGV